MHISSIIVGFSKLHYCVGHPQVSNWHYCTEEIYCILLLDSFNNFFTFCIFFSLPLWQGNVCFKNLTPLQAQVTSQNTLLSHKHGMLNKPRKLHKHLFPVNERKLIWFRIQKSTGEKWQKSGTCSHIFLITQRKVVSDIPRVTYIDQKTFMFGMSVNRRKKENSKTKLPTFYVR